MFFFFSSRRRHTRCGRDWSSDVCSSDLVVFFKGITYNIHTKKNNLPHTRPYHKSFPNQKKNRIKKTTLMYRYLRTHLNKTSQIGRASCREREKISKSTEYIKNKKEMYKI